MDKQKAIQSRWVSINRLFIVLVIFAFGILIVREYQTFRNSITFFNESSYDYQLHEVQHEVDNRIDEIRSVQSELNQEFRESLEFIVKDVDFFANEAVINFGADLTLEEKREIYINTVYQYDIQEDNYLFFAMDLNGFSYLSGLTKNLEGTNISGLQDVVTGEYFVLDMIYIINSSEDGQGFIDYFWIKELGGEHLKKTSFIYYNEEVDLFIGTGIYEVDYIQSVQDELFNRISSYYDGIDDYVYIFDYEGNVIYHPIEEFSKEDLFDVYTVNGESFHEYVVSNLETKDSVMFEYYFDYIEEHQLKTAYVRKIDEWNMYIGRSFVFDDLIVAQQQYLETAVVEYIIYNLIALISITALIVLLKSMITKNFVESEELFTLQNEIILETSYRDQLTGIYNRKYFETLLQSFKKEYKEVSVLMLDANGLKLINDAYGHQTGDTLLITLANIMKHVFKDGICFRWGGDEFIVILQKKSIRQVQEMIQEFHTMCKDTNIKRFNVSASIGYAIQETEECNIFDLINQAEVMMYNNKVYESSSTKRQIIDNILHNLYNNFDFEEQHSENVKSYALLIGQALKLDKQEMAKLRLAALLHDVGKIAVPNDVLLKSGKLNDKEFEEIRKHSEKGYRILASYPELSEFGLYALTHHERIDGTGYPKGLKGKDIPLYSRIISVADAFDAMTSSRVYKQEMSKEEAIQELLKHKGTQFDSKIVDVFIKAIK